MAESENKKNSARSNDGLSPRPPEIFEKVLWLKIYARKHWKLLLVALLISSVYLICTKFDRFLRNSKTLPETFKFVDFEDAELVQLIEDSTTLKFDIANDVSYKIRVTHTGTLRPAYREGYCLFDGGVAAVWINETKCCEIDEIRLQSWPDNPGNPRHLLEARIEKDLTEKVKNHRELVAQCIIRCLRNEN